MGTEVGLVANLKGSQLLVDAVVDGDVERSEKMAAVWISAQTLVDRPWR